MKLDPARYMTTLLLASCIMACEKSTSNNTPETPPVVASTPNPQDGTHRVGIFTLLESSFPKGGDLYVTVQASLVENAYLKVVIPVPPGAPSLGTGRPIDAKAKVAFSATEERGATNSGLFKGDVGFRWTMDPASPVIVSVSFAGRTQSIQKAPVAQGENSKFGQSYTKGILPVSLSQFGEVWPPPFSGRYEIKITNTAAAPQPFSHSLSFTAEVPTATNAKFNVERHAIDGRTFPFAQDTSGVKLATISPNVDCEGCSVSFQAVQASQRTSLVTELPALPDNSIRGFSWPVRFAGLLIAGRTCEAEAVIQENGLSKTLAFNLKGSCTTVVPWCLQNKTKNAVAGTSCPLSSVGGPSQTSFLFLNAVPEITPVKLLGHVAGVLDTSIFACAKVVLTKRGETISDNMQCFDSGPAFVVDSPALPDFARQMLKQAAQSNAPQLNH